MNRQLTWVGDVMKYKSDPVHAEEIGEATGLNEGFNGLERPGFRESVEEAADESKHIPLSPEETRESRAVATRATYFSLDRRVVQFAA